MNHPFIAEVGNAFVSNLKTSKALEEFDYQLDHVQGDIDDQMKADDWDAYESYVEDQGEVYGQDPELQGDSAEDFIERPL